MTTTRPCFLKKAAVFMLILLLSVSSLQNFGEVSTPNPRPQVLVVDTCFKLEKGGIQTRKATTNSFPVKLTLTLELVMLRENLW